MVSSTPPEGFHALLNLWARRHQLSPSQRTLLNAAAKDDDRSLAQRLNISAGELEILEKLFHMRTGRSVHEALGELGRIAERRASQRPAPPPRVR